MGNWRNRPSRRRFYDQDRRPPKSYYDPQPPSYQEYVNDGVPLWEKEFCYNVGAVPWHRVVDAKNFSCCESQILKWDDSAGEEAFHNAKKRYWALINHLPCDIPRPNPDECIDEIDWNPCIDPELVRELEQEYFAPVDDERNYRSRRKRTRNLYSDPPQSCSVNPTDAVNPWGTHNLVQSSLIVDMKGQGWGDHWEDNNSKDTNGLNNKDDNPWEKACHQGDEVVNGNTAWAVAGDNPWGWNPGSVQGGSSWEGNREASKCNGWDDVTNSGWAHNQQPPRKWNRPSGGQNDGGWRNNSSGTKAGTRKDWDDEAERTKGSEYRKPNGGWGTWKRDSWRNEGWGHEHNKTGYGTHGFEGDDYRAGGEHWRGGRSKKRVSFGYS